MTDSIVVKTTIAKRSTVQSLNGTREKTVMIGEKETANYAESTAEGERVIDSLSANNTITDGSNTVLITSTAPVNVRFSDGVYDITIPNVTHWSMVSEELIRVAVTNPSVEDVTVNYVTAAHKNDLRPIQFPAGDGSNGLVDVPAELGNQINVIIDANGNLVLQSDNTSDRIGFTLDDNGNLVMATANNLVEGQSLSINQDGYLILTTP